MASQGGRRALRKGRARVAVLMLHVMTHVWHERGEGALRAQRPGYHVAAV